MSDYRICFAGTPAFAAGHLQALLAGGSHIVGVYTQPDRPTGRGKKLLPSPVKQLALEQQLPIYQPATLKDAAVQAEFAALAPDLLIVVAYGLILPQAILDIPRLGCLNVHASLLPRWRGAAPIERAILAGDTNTGITIMQMDAGLDTGAMLHRETLAIAEDDTGSSLESKLLEVGQHSLIKTLDNLETLQANAETQDDSLSTYAAKLDKSESLIHWEDDAAVIGRQIRACAGRTPAYTLVGKQRLRLLAATPLPADTSSLAGAVPGSVVAVDKHGITVACGVGGLRVSRLQLEGKNPVSVQDWLNARPELLQPGTRLGQPGAAG
jgi:methionyl-tRNA formyltransferase